MRMRKKKNLIPRMERSGEHLVQNPYDMPGHWRELLPATPADTSGTSTDTSGTADTVGTPADTVGTSTDTSGTSARELRVEIGCGKGRFTAETAKLHPDVLFVAVEVVPEAIVVAMERCMELDNVYFIRANAAEIAQFFAPGEADGIYLNFSDPWPSRRHAKRRLTHGNFLRLYRQILRPGGWIAVKTDNAPLFDFTCDELPRYGFALSDVTRNLHENGPSGVMTDYEMKFYAQGLPVYRCVGVMEPWEEPFPADIREVRRRWLKAFAADVPPDILEKHILSPGNYLWHAFTWGKVSCLTQDAACQALKARTVSPQAECYLFYYEYPPSDVPRVQRLEHPVTEHLPEEPETFDGSDWYLVDRDFTWTYVHTHEADFGPYFHARSGDDETLSTEA